MKVFTLQADFYDTPSLIRGVFTTREQAERAAWLHALTVEDIKEVEVDVMPVEPADGLWPWHVTMWKCSDSVRCERLSVEAEPFAMYVHSFTWIECYVRAKDETEAIAVAREMKKSLA